ncbi:histidine kinase [Burkholderia sp. MSMB1552]|nr:histidine kinase [Burkholderia sp. MSMB1552]KWZ51190.1 histidine kinase [Burkholderia sp. MSMB1588]
MSESASMQMSEAIVERLNCGVFSVDRDMRILAWNGFMQYHTGCSRENAIGQVCSYLFRFDHSRPITGTIDAMRQNCSFVPLDDGGGGIGAVGVTIVDATDICIAHEALENREKRLTDALAELTARHAELSDLNRQLAHAHQQLLQSGKLAAIGQLAAGIAHEINNPVGFVLSNVNMLGGYLDALIAHAHAVGRLVAERQPQLAPALADESKEGLARVRKTRSRSARASTRAMPRGSGSRSPTRAAGSRPRTSSGSSIRSSRRSRSARARGSSAFARTA